MNRTLFVLSGLVAVGAFANGCVAPPDHDVSTRATQGMLVLGAASTTNGPVLSLSQIGCTDAGNVVVRFVLRHAGDATPGDLTGTYGRGSFGPVAPLHITADVWEYDVTLPSGEISILTASTTTAAGEIVSLQDDGDYAGEYLCGLLPPECPVAVEPVDLLCVASPLGSPTEECAHFELVPQDKDDDVTGTSVIATQDAYVAIVKSGTRGCRKGAHAYTVYVDVREGDTLVSPAGQDISHVTYCACPDPTK